MTHRTVHVLHPGTRVAINPPHPKATQTGTVVRYRGLNTYTVRLDSGETVNTNPRDISRIDRQVKA